jgi:hypothetical protein
MRKYIFFAIMLCVIATFIASCKKDEPATPKTICSTTPPTHTTTPIILPPVPAPLITAGDTFQVTSLMVDATEMLDSISNPKNIFFLSSNSNMSGTYTFTWTSNSDGTSLNIVFTISASNIVNGLNGNYVASTMGNGIRLKHETKNTIIALRKP